MHICIRVGVSNEQNSLSGKYNGSYILIYGCRGCKQLCLNTSGEKALR